MRRRSSDELFHRPDEVNPAKCAKRPIHNASDLLVASKFASGTFGQQLPFAGDGFGAAFSLSFEINAPLGFAGSCSSK
jgi:hypothetical protein